MKFFYFIILIIFFTNCKQAIIQKPVMQQLSMNDSVAYPITSITFTTNINTWQAYLLSFTQPILLNTSFNNGKLIVTSRQKEGVTEGNATICLKSNNVTFTYPIVIYNSKKTIVIQKDYRSPKTLNLDSSNLQQSIFFMLDSFRNIIPVANKLFDEKETPHPYKVATIRTFYDEPITAFYILAGTPEKIILKNKYDKNTGYNIVSTETLKDKHNNIICNGTKVTFIQNVQGKQNYIEALVLNGVAFTKFNKKTNPSFKIKAFINNIFSPEISIN